MNIISKVNQTKIPYIIGGDLNLDRNMENNPYLRNNIKDTLPLLDELIEENELTQLNWKPMRF